MQAKLLYHPRWPVQFYSFITKQKIIDIAISNASDSFYQDWHFVHLSFHQALHLGTTGAVISLRHVTNNFLSTSLAYKTSKWNGCLDITRYLRAEGKHY